MHDEVGMIVVCISVISAITYKQEITMVNIILTLDYEIHGNGQGSPLKLMVKPVEALVRHLDKYGAKLTVMADTVEILKFRSLKISDSDICHYQSIEDQLKFLINQGHDVQLHIHPAYYQAEYHDEQWHLNYNHYHLCKMPPDLMQVMIFEGKEYLSSLFCEVPF